MTSNRLLTTALLLSVLCRTGIAEEEVGAQQSENVPAKIRVLLNDGRWLTGRVAPDTNRQQLRLVLGTPNIVVTTVVATSDIAAIETPTGELTANEFLNQLGNYRVADEWSVAVPGRSQPVEQNFRRTGVRPQRTIAAISATTRLVNWDRDAALDGLILELTAIDQSGRPVAASGQLDVELIGLHRPVSGGRSSADDQRRANAPSLESWHIPIHAAGEAARARDDNGTTVLKLPFRKFKPEREPDIAFVGLLKVRFGVSGVGVFETSISDVIIREPSLFRDELFLSTGRRLLPGEHQE